MAWEQTGLLTFCLMLVLVLVGVHISFALGFTGLLGLIILLGFDAGTATLSQLPYIISTSFTYIAIPLFILMGNFAVEGGLATQFYFGVNKLLGRLPAGLALATTAACTGFAACSGSSLACAATFAKLSVPEMVRYGYSKEFACAVVVASGTIGVMIPPSIDMIIICAFTEQSVARMFLAGFMPGLLQSVSYFIMMVVRAWRDSKLAPRVSGIPWRETLSSLPKLWELFLLAGLVLGGIYGGIFTPTEAAAAGAGVALMMGLIQRRLTVPKITEALTQTAESTAMLFLILVGAYIFSRFIAISGLPTAASELIIGSSVSPTVVMALVTLLYLILGMFVSPIAMFLLTIPVVYPMLIALGFDGIWYGIFLVKMSEIGMITPPFALNAFVVKGVITDASLGGIFRNSFWFLALDMITLTLLIIFPQIALWLPNLVLGKPNI